jgi:hypothetical protein
LHRFIQSNARAENTFDNLGAMAMTSFKGSHKSEARNFKTGFMWIKIVPVALYYKGVDKYQVSVRGGKYHSQLSE